jgi:hypothetical protein
MALLRENKVETDQLYIKAFEDILKGCAEKFSKSHIKGEEN